MSRVIREIEFRENSDKDLDNCRQFSGFRKSRFRDDSEKCNFRLQLDCNRMWSVEGFNSLVSTPFQPIVFDHCLFHVIRFVQNQKFRDLSNRKLTRSNPNFSNLIRSRTSLTHYISTIFKNSRCHFTDLI